jgi:hypothetical protein
VDEGQINNIFSLSKKSAYFKSRLSCSPANTLPRTKNKRHMVIMVQGLQHRLDMESDLQS